jgi:hypothetical protein
MVLDDLDLDALEAGETDFDAELMAAEDEAVRASENASEGRELSVMEVIGLDHRRRQIGVETVERIERDYGYDLIINDHGTTYSLAYDARGEILGIGTQLV